MNPKSSIRALRHSILKWFRSADYHLEGEKRIYAGRGTYGLRQSQVQMSAGSDRLIIGNFCSISKDARFVCEGHRTAAVSTYPFRTKFLNTKDNQDSISKGPIIVGNDVWVASGAVVLSGVNIGDGAVLAAGALVTKDVPPYAIVMGAPARIAKYRFDPATIKKLQAIAWWNWPDEIIISNIDDFYGPVHAFIEKHYKSGSV